MGLRKFIAGICILFATLSTAVSASPRDEFCAGFSEGYKSIKGNMVMVPLCPLAPLTPLGSTPFREGIKAGISAASRG